MKRFQFKLDPFLKYREFLERKAQQEVAGAQKAVSDCKKNIDQSRLHLHETFDTLDQEMSAGIDAERYQAYATYITGIETFIESENRRLQKLVQVLHQKQQALAQKAREKKAIDNLKERQRTEYYDHMFKLLQKENDDTVIIRKARELQK